MNKNVLYASLAFLVMALILASGVAVAFVKEYSILFLVTLCCILLTTSILRNRFNRPLVITARLLLGLVFVFSGFVKGVDPLGTEYVIHDYFEAYGTPWAFPLAKALSLLMNAFEFTIGVMLLLNIRLPLVSWLVALMMAFFTATTLGDALFNPVPDCGCFGKALILSNWQTFYKNLVLDALVVILLFGRFRVRNTFSCRIELLLTTIVAALFVGFEFFNLRHLPVIDFLDWKTNERLLPEKMEPVEYYFTYQHKQTGETREYLLADLPHTDPDFKENWEMVGHRVIDNNYNFMIPVFDARTADGQDMADYLLNYPEPIFIVAVYDLSKARLKNKEQLLALMDGARERGCEFIFLTDLVMTDEMISDFKKRLGREDLDIYFSDDKSIKSIVRSNPGMVLLKDARVLGKWAWRDLPTLEKIDLLIQK